MAAAAVSPKPSAPSAESMSTVRIEALSEETFAGALAIQNEFLGRGKGCCFGCLPYSMCPMSLSDFSKPLKKHPEILPLIGVARRAGDGEVIGIIFTVHHGTPRTDPVAGFFHTVKPGEAYVDALAVTAAARGQGVGTKLLKWGEAVAREAGADRYTLAVARKNPAMRLYERYGFEFKQKGACHQCFVDCCACFWIGSPNGGCGARDMVMPFAPEQEQMNK